MKPHENFQQKCIYLKLHKDWKKNLETVYRRLVNPRETHMLISSDQKRRVTQSKPNIFGVSLTTIFL